MRRAASRAVCTAGRSRPISVAMIAITTKSSTSVNPRRRRQDPIGMLRARKKHPQNHRPANPPPLGRRYLFEMSMSNTLPPPFTSNDNAVPLA